jgi:hypothetical protein
VRQGPLFATALVGAAVLVVVLTTARRSKEELRAIFAVLRSQAGLRRTRWRHASLVRRAERALHRSEREHSAAVATLDRRIAELEDPRGRRLDALGPVRLHELRLITPAGEVPLDGVEATLDMVGNLSERKRTTLTRLALGGLVLGPLGAILALGFPKRRTVDDRELYLMIEAGTASCVVSVRPDDGARVRAFATRINGAAAVVGERRFAVAAELADARKRLSEVREDHRAMDAARARLDSARNDRRALAAIAEAETALAGARSTLARIRG